MPSSPRLGIQGAGFVAAMVERVAFRDYGGRGDGWGRQLYWMLVNRVRGEGSLLTNLGRPCLLVRHIGFRPSTVG
jgi:hypothetical protein